MLVITHRGVTADGAAGRRDADPAGAGRRRHRSWCRTTPRRRKALELTFREALRLGHNYVGTEHILLALLELDGGDGPLGRLGLDRTAVEADVRQLLSALEPE